MNKVTIRKGKAPVPAQYARLHPDHRIIHHLTQTDAYKYSQGQFLLKDGKKLETEKENLAELKLQVKGFTEQTLPILTRLGIL